VVSDILGNAFAEVARSVLEAARDNEALRLQLRTLARAILDEFPDNASILPVSDGPATSQPVASEPRRGSVMSEFEIPDWSAVGGLPPVSLWTPSPPPPPPATAPASIPPTTVPLTSVSPKFPASPVSPAQRPPATTPTLPFTPPEREAPRDPNEPLPELTLGQGRKTVDTLPVNWTGARGRLPGEFEDLGLVGIRCRLKADGMRWAVERRRRIAAQLDFAEHVAPRDKDIIAAAKATPNCFLWMNAADFVPPTDFSLCDRVADWYEALGETLQSVRRLQDEETPRPSVMEQGVYLLAEGQSALRAAIGPVASVVDSDQIAVFNWLKEFASRERVFIRRHMRVDDVADPSTCAAFRERVAEFARQVDSESARKKATKKLFNKLKYVASQIVKDPAEAAEHWAVELEVISVLLSEGIAPSDKEMREALLPAIDFLPDDLEIPDGAKLVFRELDRYLATVDKQAADGARESALSEEVQRVRELLEGRTVMLIGGDRREGSEKALCAAFGLGELNWVVTSEQHQSVADFESHVSRPETALVLLAIRWSRHAYGEVRHLCEKHGKPLVWLPGGYNPNQVAAQIMKQSSDRLRKLLAG
jgi:hypothetical protein